MSHAQWGNATHWHVLAAGCYFDSFHLDVIFLGGLPGEWGNKVSLQFGHMHLHPVLPIRS